MLIVANAFRQTITNQLLLSQCQKYLYTLTFVVSIGKVPKEEKNANKQ